jgi:Bacterial antitoxin of type II TA system, VapB
MKTTVDIPEKELKEIIKNTGAKTKREAILTAVRKFNKSKRQEELSDRLHGSMPDFMTQEDLKILREAAKSGLK